MSYSRKMCAFIPSPRLTRTCPGLGPSAPAPPPADRPPAPRSPERQYSRHRCRRFVPPIHPPDAVRRGRRRSRYGDPRASRAMRSRRSSISLAANRASNPGGGPRPGSSHCGAQEGSIEERTGGFLPARRRRSGRGSGERGSSGRRGGSGSRRRRRRSWRQRWRRRGPRWRRRRGRGGRRSGGCGPWRERRCSWRWSREWSGSRRWWSAGNS